MIATANATLYFFQNITELISSDHYSIPGTTHHTNCLRRVAGRLGLDFVVAGIKFVNRQVGKHALHYYTILECDS